MQLLGPYPILCPVSPPAGQTRVLQAEESAFRRDKRQPVSSSRQRWVLQPLHLKIKFQAPTLRFQPSLTPGEGIPHTMGACRELQPMKLTCGPQKFLRVL